MIVDLTAITNHEARKALKHAVKANVFSEQTDETLQAYVAGRRDAHREILAMLKDHTDSLRGFIHARTPAENDKKVKAEIELAGAELIREQVYKNE
jgi:hypothetical protein